MNEENVKVILKFGYDISLCLSLQGAIKILQILGSENLLRKGNKKVGNDYVEVLQPYGTDAVTVGLISPTEYLRLVSLGEKEG